MTVSVTVVLPTGPPALEVVEMAGVAGVAGTPAGSENAAETVAGGFSPSLTWAVSVALALPLPTPMPLPLPLPLVGVPEMTPVAAMQLQPGGQLALRDRPGVGGQPARRGQLHRVRHAGRGRGAGR